MNSSGRESGSRVGGSRKTQRERHNIISVMEESDTLRIAKEDVLRILAEKAGKKSPLESIKLEVKVSNSFISEAIRGLEKESLLQVREDFIGLTKKGQDYARGILEKHLTFEGYLKKTRSEVEAHEAAHILEHYVSQEVTDNVKRLSTFEKEGSPLTEFEFNKEGIITNITFSDPTLFERIVSMGIVPGERIKITSKIGNTIIVDAVKRFALGEDVAQGIEVLAYERD
jgi:Mn-dependent DtxR family transcriptional regulator